mmetsp:Transcript_29009/g.52563  ORF Transcript_29009/g.52563 Transcript_29009/m.52563 type:complete len:215 (-) Transcript_29009:156-800(-)
MSTHWIRQRCQFCRRRLLFFLFLLRFLLSPFFLKLLLLNILVIRKGQEGHRVGLATYEVIVGVDPIDAGGCAAEGLGGVGEAGEVGGEGVGEGFGGAVNSLKLFRGNNILHQPIHHLWMSIKCIQRINFLIPHLHLNRTILHIHHIPFCGPRRHVGMGQLFVPSHILVVSFQSTPCIYLILVISSSGSVVVVGIVVGVFSNEPIQEALDAHDSS